MVVNMLFLGSTRSRDQNNPVGRVALMGQNLVLNGQNRKLWQKLVKISKN